MTLTIGYFLIILAWLIFGIIHSALASRKIKEKAQQLGVGSLAYRRIYNLLAVFLMLLILLGGGFIQPEYFMPHGKSSRGIGLILATFGFFLTKMAFKEISFAVFIGLKEEKKTELVKTGIYARIRHPLYTATILFLTGFVIFSPSYTNLVHAICLFVYLIIGVRYEEKRLLKNYGIEYEQYQKQVPMLLPRISLPK